MPNRQQDPRLLDALTAREREVLSLLGRGRTSKEIARQLDLSVTTVATHRRSLCPASTGIRLRAFAGGLPRSA